MKKTEGSEVYQNIKSLLSYELCVVNTFESTSESSDSRLNRNFCLLLNNLGVKKEFFFKLMQLELNRILVVHTDRSAAYRLVRQYKSCIQPELKMADSDSDDSEFDLHEMAFEDQIYFKSPNLYLNRKSRFQQNLKSIKALDFLLASHSLKEPMLQKLLIQMQRDKLRQLKEFRMKMSGLVYLVGIPDPYGDLLENEVFIVISRTSISEQHSPENTNQLDDSIVGEVLVTRNPMMHPGNIDNR